MSNAADVFAHEKKEEVMKDDLKKSHSIVLISNIVDIVA
jgi:hypothetical protein